ncbi:MAG: bifunctional adenosylcobinamide kinase/adenosylcobinamide-phosphate guanylyltransferase [Alphaproteobacteria bacterium]|nr:bifunctional adenosylcobinamide kinase/adenosylcobinamide-phosphate guanylyltransferase [Alphaproteobacteria bacterium]
MNDQNVLPALTVVLGGACSGKTAHGLRLAEEAWRTGNNARLCYLATAQVWDQKMAEKVRLHQAERTTQPWRTIEEPLKLCNALSQFDDQDIVLLDSVGMWVSNLLLAEREPELTELCAVLETCTATLIMIADEAGLGVVPRTQLGRRFRDTNGLANQKLCATAARVDFVRAGLVQTLKTADRT